MPLTGTSVNVGSDPQAYVPVKWHLRLAEMVYKFRLKLGGDRHRYAGTQLAWVHAGGA